MAAGKSRSGGASAVAVAVDVVVFTIADGELRLLLVELQDGPFRGTWGLPGGRLGSGELLEQAALRELSAQTGIREIYLEQLRTFDALDRDPLARVVSTAYFALVRGPEVVGAAAKYAAAAWFPARGLPDLAYDHDRIVGCALDRLRAKIEYTNIVCNLLPREFSLGELQRIYEILLGRGLDRRNFRKKILATGLLRPLQRERRGAGRPAALYCFVSRRPTVVEIL